MSKKNPNKAAATENAAAYNTAKGPISQDTLFTAIENAESLENVDFIPLNSNMLELKEGDVINCAFTGFETLHDKEGNPYTAARLLFKDGSAKTNADKVLISTMEKWQAKNPGSDTCIIRIVCRGTRKGDRGAYKDLEIFSFS